MDEAALDLFDLPSEPPYEDRDIKVRCPLPEHEDRNPSATLNVVKRKWYCHKCKEGGSVDELLNKNKNGEAVVPEGESLDVAPYVSDEMLNNEHREWLSDRRLSLDNCCVRYVSIRDNGDGYLCLLPTVGIPQLRNMKAGAEPRYKTGDATDGCKSKLFWASPLPPTNGLVWLAEGPLDAVALEHAGAAASCASLGTGLSDQQAYELREFFVLIAYDRDAAGVTGAEKAVEKLAKFGGTCAIVELPDAGGCKDPGDLWQKRGDELATFVSSSELEYQPDEQRYVKAWREFSSFSPVPTGNSELDHLLGGGWLPGVHVVKGPPKSFKSTIMLSQARAAARAGRGVLYLTTELSRREVWARLAAGIPKAPKWSALEVDPSILPESCYTALDEMAKYITVLGNVPLKRLLQVADETEPSIVIVDYLQGLSSVTGKDASGLLAKVKDASAMLTAWARDRERPVLAVSSVSAEGAGPKYSGDVSYDAASVSSIKVVGHVPSKSVRQWHFEMIRRGLPEGDSSGVVTIDAINEEE